MEESMHILIRNVPRSLYNRFRALAEAEYGNRNGMYLEALQEYVKSQEDTKDTPWQLLQ